MFRVLKTMLNTINFILLNIRQVPYPIYPQTMSSYLLLRDNKESGPLSLDEVKSMSLKSFDLIWVVGKSAAWRYPEEIEELKSFVPATPVQVADFFSKKTSDESQISSLPVSESSPGHKSTDERLPNSNNRSVYFNLPAGKTSELADRISEEQESSGSENLQSDDHFPGIYREQPSNAVRYSGKILWFGTVILLFGAGIMTGFFISDRRKFFTSDENHPQNNAALQQVVFKDKKENTEATDINNASINSGLTTILNPDSVRKRNGISKKSNIAAVKKIFRNNEINKDSLAAEVALQSALRIKDSLKQDAINKRELLYQKIKTNPENYLNLVTGRYSTGLFGGISSFPVTITNNSSVKIESLEVTINYVQNNDKVFKSETLSFNELEPGETLTMKAPKSTRGTKIITHLHIINVHQPDPVSSN
jgi:hypothetical protein